MNSYSSYKDSGVEWIGEIPKDWKTSKFKLHSEIVTGNTPSKLKEEEYYTNNVKGFPWVKPTSLNQKFNFVYESEEYLTEEGKNQTRVIPKNSIMVCSIGNTLGKFGISGEEMSTNQQINSVICDEISLLPRFCMFFISVLTEDLIKWTNFVTLPIFTKSDFKDTNIIIPSTFEQTQIVSFLDTKTKKIDELIENTEQKIKLLKEKRTSLINHCVTKGLNSDVEMKDSGVEWIGEIPKDWLVSKIMFITNKVTDGSHHSPETEDEGKLYVTVSNVTKGNDIDFNSCSKISGDSFSDLEKNGCKPEKGDVLITKDGTIGRGLVVSGFNDYVILSSIGLIRFQEKINPYYGLYYLLSGLNIDQMYSHVRGSGITRLTINLIKNLLFILPSETEQNQIVEYLDEQTQKIDSTIEKETQRIELLKEYRQSLISEVVTGKVDVRDWNG